MKRSNKPKFSQQLSRLAARRGPWLWGAALVALVAVVYWPTLANGFVWDDDAHVENNRTLTSPSGLLDIWFKLGAIPQYYPLVHSTFWVEYHIWGLDPRGYHVLNLLLHATSAVLVWRLLARLAVPGAWLAAAIFAVHPLSVESVAWVTERKNVLSYALAMGSILAYLRFSPAERFGAVNARVPPQRGHWRYYALALGLYVTALLSKTVTASVPAVLLVIYWWKRGQLTWRDAARLTPFFAVGLALSGITVWMEKAHVGASGDEWDMSSMDRVLVAGRALWFYAGKLVWPHPLIFFYPRWMIDASSGWQYLFPATVLAVFTGLWLAQGRIGRGPLAAVLIFAGVLTPALGFFDVYPFRYSFVADHFQYHASIALIALFTATLVLVDGRLALQSHWVGRLAVIGVLVPLGVVAQQRTRVYKDVRTLHGNTVALNPTAWVAPVNMGSLLFKQGKYDAAILQYRQAIEILEKLVDENPTIANFDYKLAGGYLDVGFAQRKAGRPGDTEVSYRQAIEILARLARDNPTIGRYQHKVAATYVDLGLLERQMGRPAEAERSFREAIQYRDQLVRDHPAVSDYQAGLAWCYVHLGLVQRKTGQLAEAETSHRKAIEIRERLVVENPTVADYPDELALSHVDLSLVQRDMGRTAEAESSLQKSIEIREKLAQDNPLIGKYRNDIAAGYLDLGILQRDGRRTTEAESAFRQATEIREKLVRDHPNVREYREGLAWCYVHLASTQQKTGRLVDAEASQRQAIEIREKLARDNPTTNQYKEQSAASYEDVGILQRDMARPDEAVISCQKAVDLRTQLVRDNPARSDYQHDLAVSYRELGDVRRAAGRSDDALASFRTAIAIHQKLAADYPTVAGIQSNLASDLALCGDSLALLGHWKESADLYSQAVRAGDYSRETLWRCALVSLAAGNEAGYRATCAELMALYGKESAPDALLSMALTLVVGEKALDDMSQVLALAERAAAANPSDPVAAILLGAAQYRAGRGKKAISTLAKTLARLDSQVPPAAARNSDQVFVGRLVGEALLAVAYREQTGRNVPQKRLETLQKLVDNPQTPGPQDKGSLPPWAARFAVEIAKRELARLSASAGGNQ